MTWQELGRLLKRVFQEEEPRDETDHDVEKPLVDPRDLENYTGAEGYQ